MQFEPIITIGTLLEILTFAIGGLIIVVQMRAGLQYQGERLNALEREVHELGELVVSNARMEERIINLNSQVITLQARMALAEQQHRTAQS